MERETPEINNTPEGPNDQELINFIESFGLLNPAQITKLRQLISIYPQTKERVANIIATYQKDQTEARMLVENLTGDLKKIMEVEE